jgi:hypothetical protein
MTEAINLISDVIELLTELPSGIDWDADEEDDSPDDMTAHIGGLALRKLERALDLLIPHGA